MTKGYSVLRVFSWSENYKPFSLFIHISFKMDNKMKMLSSEYPLQFKNIILFLNFFSNGHFQKRYCYVDQRSENRYLKWQLCFDVVWYYSNQCWKDEFDLTLFNVLNFNVELHNVVSTLIWCCATSWCQINLKATLTRRWNVCCSSFG